MAIAAADLLVAVQKASLNAFPAKAGSHMPSVTSDGGDTVITIPHGKKPTDDHWIQHIFVAACSGDTVESIVFHREVAFEDSDKPSLVIPAAKLRVATHAAGGRELRAFEYCTKDGFWSSGKALPGTNKPVLLYFGLPGRAHVIRCLMYKVYGKDGWTDEKISFPAYGAEKQKLLSGGSSVLVTPYLPNLTTPSGLQIGEAVPISKWVASNTADSSVRAMYPEGDARAVVDEAISIIYGACEAPGGATDAEKKAAREKWAAGPLQTHLKLFSARLAKNDGPFILGKQITLADLWAYFFTAGMLKGVFDYVDKSVLDPYPLLVANCKAVVASPLMQEYQKAYAGEFEFDF